MKRTLCAGALLLMLACLVGCGAGFRGAPKAPFDLAEVERSQLFLKPEAQLEKLALADSEEARNEAMTRILSLIDIRYVDFRHNLAANKKHSSAITSALLLAADIVGGLTTSAGVKDNYLAFSALLTGGELIYDKNYMYEQTIAALVTQMDASRSSKLLEIRKVMAFQSIHEYPGQVAVNDLLQYYHAGTLLGAITAIQVKAGAETQQNAESLRQLKDAPMQTTQQIRAGTRRLDDMVNKLDDAQLRDLKSYLLGAGREVGYSSGRDELRSELRKLRSEIYPENFDALVESLGKAGMTVPPASEEE